MKHLTEEEIINYLEDPGSFEETVNHIQLCDQCQQLANELKELMLAMDNSAQWNAPTSVAQSLAAAIEEEKAVNTTTHSISYWQIAAAIALLVVGFALGKWTTSDHQNEVIALQSQVELLKEIAVVNMLEKPTASQRIQAVNQIDHASSTASVQVINTLINTLNTDESPNVRYSAAQALAQFTDQQIVRLELAKSLELQTDPLIQIALISILTESNEKNAVSPLRGLIDSESTAPEVKRQAEIALEILI